MITPRAERRTLFLQRDGTLPSDSRGVIRKDVNRQWEFGRVDPLGWRIRSF